MIDFKKLKWRNFLSTGNSWIEMDLARNNSTLIIGDNGAGKSTMIDALTVVLFNKPFRNINKPQMINSINKKSMEIDVEFLVGTHVYRVRRGEKPKIFEIYKDGEMLDQDADSRDQQKHLEQDILKMNYKTFTQVVILGSRLFIPFMQLSAPDRRDIVEDLLDIQVFGSMQSLLKDRIKENNSQISDNEYLVETTEDKIRIHRSFENKVEENFDEQINQLEESIRKTQKEMELDQDNIFVLEEGKTKLLETVTDQDNIDDRKLKINNLLRDIQKSISDDEKDIEFFDVNDDCPVCRQPITDEFKHDHVGSKKAHLDKLVDGKKDLSGKLALVVERQDEIMKVLSNVSDITSQQRESKASFDGKERTVESWLRDQERLRNRKDEKKEDTSIDQDEVNKLELELKQSKDTDKQLHSDKKLMATAGAMLKDDGIKSVVIRQFVPTINALVNKYLSLMEYHILFEFDDQFNESIKSTNRETFSYGNFSEGEKMRIDLAILFAWRDLAKMKNSISTNLLIMDELFDSSLDSHGTAEFTKIIKHLTKNNNTFIISHKTDSMLEEFNNVIVFKTEDNFSSMVA